MIVPCVKTLAFSKKERECLLVREIPIFTPFSRRGARGNVGQFARGACTMETAGELAPSVRILLGPGPSNVHSRVLKAMSTPLVGHLDPEFVRLMEETKALLRLVFQTKNMLTLPISGTGSAGMETCFVNLLEPGDEVIVGVNGVFGTRMVDVIERVSA